MLFNNVGALPPPLRGRGAVGGKQRTLPLETPTPAPSPQGGGENEPLATNPLGFKWTR